MSFDPRSRAVVRVVPSYLTQAIAYVGEHHRHLSRPQSGLFAARAECDGVVVGAAIVGRPIARGDQTGWRCEITRVATDGTFNACTLLYAALARAARALGWCEIVTKILEREPGTSLRAAGWEDMGLGDPRPAREWSCSTRARKPAEEPGRKRRFRKRLCDGCARCARQYAKITRVRSRRLCD